jgi:hypothetical protein
MIANEVLSEIVYTDEPVWETIPDSLAAKTHWRRLVLDAYREAVLQEEADVLAKSESEGRSKSEHRPVDPPDDEDAQDEPRSLPDATSEDDDDWEFLVHGLVNRILWEDGDYNPGHHFLDADLAEARLRMKLMGIDKEYYTAIAPDPLDDELEPIRRTLRSLCGRPEPKELNLIDGIWDSYHDLYVGPCDAEVIFKESDCSLVEPAGVLGEDGFDCSYAEWANLFREEVYRIGSAESPVSSVPKVALSRHQLARARKAREAGEPMLVDDVHRVEPHEGAWIVADLHGNALAEIEACAWANIGDVGMPPLKFSTPQEALIGYLRSKWFAAARQARYEAAMRRLGRE